MDSLQIISLIALVCVSVTILLSVVCIASTHKARTVTKHTLALAAELEGRLTAVSKELDQVAQREAEQARRIAWLESRVRLRASESEPTVASESTPPAKPGITERRRRVLALARRGMDAEAIAATLGVPHGEVELIIGLSNAA